jgi:indole-3-glycerol phosphate synthase
MNSILEKIVQYKKLEVEQLRAVAPLTNLVNDYRLNNDSLSMESAILQGSGVIAEFKRSSPSKGLINGEANVIHITSGYQKAGASAISVLTDSHFFSALPDDLVNARENVRIPVLRKDFTIDIYQIYQAKIMGADCILLIAAILTAEEIKQFTKVAADLGLECILEIHHPNELDKLSGNERIIGVNNRNLDTFEVNIETSLKLADQLGEVVKITESGLSSGSNLRALTQAGFNGFLVGESFMKDPEPDLACKNFVDEINKLKS